MFLTSAMIGLVPLEDMVVNSASASLTQMVGGLLKTFFFWRGFASKSRKLFGPTIHGFIFNLGVNQFDGQIESDSWVTQDWEGIFLILGQKMAEAVEHIAQLL